MSVRRVGYCASAVLALACLSGGALAAFGLTTTSNIYKVDTNGGLVFEVDRANGDITSLVFNGVEYQGKGKASAINSGLGTSQLSAETISNKYIKITVKANSLPVTQYYIAKPDDPTIYMATYITGEVSPGELRWLGRLRQENLPTGVHGDVGNTIGCTAFEGKDTFRCPNQETRCKMYTSDRFIDDQIHGVSGSNAAVWMIMPGVAYETSSGGPFMRDINSQTGSSDQELYWYMNSGHVRTEPWRFGLMGPYAMKFTNKADKPSPSLDTSFFSTLDIQGYVPDNQRGSVSGTASGVPKDFEAVVHWYNDKAQYWTKAANGAFESPLMKPGTYTMKLYKGEYEVAKDTVTVTAGSDTAKNIASAEPNTSVVWRIGNFDGQPLELKNGDKIERMHPSDARMGSWGGTYTVGQSSGRDFPMALFSKTGGNVKVNFNLAANQVRDLTLRVGTTLSFKGGRPSVAIGSWTGKDPGAPKLIDSRGVTRGAYRGYGEVYTWTVPASALKTGQNTLTLGVYGSGDADFLSANYILDAIELQGPAGAD
ncbi:polysaccharide lyase family 4 protein [Daldinia loculata]|uniref:polysaccharide lyase family 4 protein n=1 Tax=Daldinia loculata TaxID=103429 RepID=UPI0020C36FC1|nr:polysaccharide lyase family 4 protein [Daldinia loculata]KAI1642378.1 polysaccharide lyase family 4 protein [Daldinia loculata]